MLTVIDADKDRPSASRYLLFAAIGLVGGTLFGSLGAGGGIVMVPLMLWFARIDQRRAAATSLLAVVPTALAGSLSFLLAGHLDVAAALVVACGGVVGSLIGTRLLRVIPLVWLRWLFIAVLVAFALRLLFSSPSRGAELALEPGVVLGLVALGLATGIASGLFGIGGGVIIVPVLIAFLGVSDLVAKGTALLAMIPMATAGSIANLRAGLLVPREGVAIALGAAVGAVGGSLVAFALPARLSAILFSVLVLLIVIQMTVRAVRLGRSE